MQAILFTAIAAQGEQEVPALRERHQKILGECAARFRGRVLEEGQRGSLAVFASAADAVACCLAIQEEPAGEPALRLRSGVDLGDPSQAPAAARIGSLAEPGGVCVSSRVWEQVRGLSGLEGTRLAGADVWALHASSPRRRSWLRRALLGAGLLFVLVAVFAAIPPAREAVLLGLIRANAVHVFPVYQQTLRSTTTSDGARIAWASIGAGPAVVNVPGWPSHLERGFGSPGNNIVVPLLKDSHRVLVYDERGFGLSERGSRDVSLAARVRDLEAVLDAAGVERASVIGLSAGSLPAIAFAAQHPERVERLFLYGAGTRFGTEQARELVGLMREGESPASRKLFRQLFMPEADAFTVRAFGVLERAATDSAGAADFLAATLEMDVSALAPRVRAPTLLVAVRGDRVVPYDDARRLASLIPHARLVTLEGRNHTPLPGEPVTGELDDLMLGFLSQGQP